MPELRTIAEDDDGIRLDRWFKRHYPAFSHGRLEKLLRKGEVRLDGKRAKAADRIVAGQSLRLPPQVIHDKAEERPKPAMVKTTRRLEDAILYMDKHLIVLNKPAGLATQGGSGLSEHVDGMLDQLAFEKTTRPKLVHRLDRDTSGVLLVARTAQAAAGLSRALAGRDASKIYWALVKGVPRERYGIVKAALAKEGARGKGERMTVSKDDDAKFALTEYAVMGQAGQEFAWVAARPVTGRTHQIRVHLASLGTPIVGDFKYGGTDAKGKGAIADKLHLHARSIDIARPDGGRLQVIAPLPPHMVKSWELLGFSPVDKRDPFPKKKSRQRASGEAHKKSRR
jgi:23S rRNA pseudouridine955/2504/2580 synthase